MLATYKLEEEMQISGNLSDTIWVKLTEYGHAVLRASLMTDNLSPSELECVVSTHHTANGWSSFLLWKFMQIFGQEFPTLTNATQVIVDNTIHYTRPSDAYDD